VEDGETGLLELRGVAGGVASRRGHEAHPLVDDEVDDGRVADEGLGDVHPEGLVGEIAHLADLVPHGIELTGRRLDDAEGAGVGDGGRQLGPGDPTHGCLHDRELDAEQLGDAVGDGHRPWLPPSRPGAGGVVPPPGASTHHALDRRRHAAPSWRRAPARPSGWRSCRRRTGGAVRRGYSMTRMTSPVPTA
jgi:hypothetical protein